MSFDRGLAETLIAAAPRGSNLFEALVEFNAANTDSPDVPEHVEVVMVKSAFEFLLRCRPGCP